MGVFEKVTIEKATLFISLLGLFLSILLATINIRANIALEEKKLEATLFMQAIQVNNKKSTLDNLKFLLHMGAISKDREQAIQSLSDSIYIDKSESIYTKSEGVGYCDFEVLNSKTDGVYFEKTIKGGAIQIESLDTNTHLQIQAFTDNFGKAELYYPDIYCNQFVKIKVMKNGYKTKVLEKRLPEKESVDFEKISIKILLEKE